VSRRYAIRVLRELRAGHPAHLSGAPRCAGEELFARVFLWRLGRTVDGRDVTVREEVIPVAPTPPD
jgi:hypothetical protein